ncbi:STAS-like domain-containing protein [Crenothrix polyspora]|uniref:DUF4325 domain-containing protein n=1 Tax=Crenothrix polyspora TaxID=360316 RepID=A0A1R4H8J2_9GAMM|nr:STAS-like domain-containing protein [Crenothrix polyspora]SJM92554.1 conserved hypothetical protein [Crenothrix polyspora]
MSKSVITIAKDFSRYPAGRYLSDGPCSGTKFREEFLIDTLNRNQHADIIFDGARGYGSSFLEEAFGGLVRLGFSKSKILEAFTFISNNDPTIPDEIIDYIDEAEEEK